MNGQREPVALVPLTKEEGFYSSFVRLEASFPLKRQILFSFCTIPACSQTPSCYPIAPLVPFSPPKTLLFSPHQMVLKKEPLSRLVLTRAYLLIGKEKIAGTDSHTG